MWTENDEKALNTLLARKAQVKEREQYIKAFIDTLVNYQTHPQLLLECRYNYLVGDMRYLDNIEFKIVLPGIATDHFSRCLNHDYT